MMYSQRLRRLYLVGAAVAPFVVLGFVWQFTTLAVRAEGPLLDENFDYGDTAGPLIEVSSWYPRYSGDCCPVQYQTSSLSLPGYSSSGRGGSATFASGSGWQDVYHTFPGQSSGTLYYAALVKISGADANTGEYFLHFADAKGSNPRGWLYAKASGGHLFFGLSADGISHEYGPTSFVPGDRYLVVVRYDLDSGDGDLYVLDSYSATQPAVPEFSIDGEPFDQPTASIAIRQGSNYLAGQVDGIRVATTWADAVGRPSLDIAKSAPEFVAPEGTVTYTISITNGTGVTVTNTVITDSIPTNATYVDASASNEGGLDSEGTVTWAVSELPAGDVISRTFEVTAPDLNGVDLVNDHYGVIASNWTTPALGSPITTSILLLDLSVAQTGPDFALEGRDVVYTITLQSRGLVTASGAILTDTLPLSVTYVSDDSEWTAHSLSLGARDVITWPVGDVPPNTTYTFELTGTLSPIVANGTLSNEVTASTESAGDVAGNNTVQWQTAAYPFVTIATARAGSIGQTYAIEGQAIYVPGTYDGAGWGLQDDSGGIAAYYTPPPSVQLGDWIQLLAPLGNQNGEERMETPEFYDNLGAGPALEPQPYSTGEVDAGLSEGWLVVVSGTVSGLGTCSTSGYSFDVDDGTGAARIHVDGTTGIDVCSMGFTNGDFVKIVGFSTQYNSAFEIKPRFPGDVWRRPTGLILSKSAPVSVVQGSAFTYTLVARNDAGVTTTGVVISDSLPLSVTISAISDDGVDLGGNVVSWTVSSLAPNAAVTRSVVVTAPLGLHALLNSDYGVRATDYLTCVVGPPVSTHVVLHTCSICAVQGFGDLSLYRGQAATVTGVIYDLLMTGGPSEPEHGFFMQAKAGTEDGDPASSDGIYVYLGSNTTIGDYTPTVGDEISLQGMVADGSAPPAYGNTLLESPFTLVVNFGPVPDLDTAVPPTEISPTGTLTEASVARERVESMRVEVPPGSLVVAPTHLYARSNDTEFYVIRGDHPVALRTDPFERRVYRDPHPLDNEGGSGHDGNPYRISVEANVMKGNATDYDVQLPRANVYDVVSSALVGPMYYGYGRYTLMVEDTPVLSPTVNAAQDAPPQPVDREIEYSVSTLNAENLYDVLDDPSDGCDFDDDSGCLGVEPPFDYVPSGLVAYQTHLAKLARQVVSAMQSPDIVVIEEAEDQDICAGGGQVYGTCDIQDNADGLPDVLQDLAKEIQIQSDDTISYQVALDRAGADYRGIVVGFLYRADRVELVPAAALASNPVLGSRPSDPCMSEYPHNGEVLNPKALQAVASTAGQADGGGADLFERLPQVALFRVHRTGQLGDDFVDVYVIGNHFKSGPDSSVERRTEQAAYNDQLVADIEAVNPSARVAVLGDLNTYPDSVQLASLGSHTDNLVREIPLSSRYSYTHNGQTETLDQIFASGVLSKTLAAVRVAHVNADWSYEYQDDDASICHASDHDPVVATFLLPRQADLTGSFERVDPPGNVSNGELLTYTIVLSNSGEVDAAISITDELSTGLLLIEGLDGDGLTWSGVVTGGEQVTLTLVAQADPALTADAVVSNVLTIDDGVHAPFAIAAPDTTILVPHLSISKEVAPSLGLGPGDVVTYTIVVRNSGDGLAGGVAIADVLPPRVAFGGWVEQDSASQEDGTLTWTGDVPGGDQMQLIFTATLDTDSSLCGQTITNTALFSSDNAGNGLSDAELRIVCQPADLTSSFVRVDPAGEVNAGDLLTYTIVLRNTGQVDATVNITDELPVELLLVEGLDGGGLTWSGVVVAGEQVTLSLVAQADPSLPGNAIATNVVSVDDGVHAPFDVAAPKATILVPHLSITNDVSPHEDVRLGGVVTYTIMLANSGQGLAAGVAVTDELPADLVFDGWKTRPANASHERGMIAWRGDVTGGGQVRFVFTARVGTDPALLGRIDVSTVSFVSENAGSDSADAILRIEQLHRVYMPVVLKSR